MKKIISALLVLLPLNILAADDGKWSFGLSIGYSPNYLVTMESTQAGTTEKYEMEYASSTEFGATLWRMPKNDWAFMAAADIGKERKLEKLIDNGITYTPTAGQAVPTFQTHFIRVGTAYRWETFYIPFGLSYGITKMTIPTSGTLDVKGGIGGFFGLGWNINDTVVIEYIGRSALMEYTFKPASGGPTETGKGVIGSALLNLKVMF